MMGRCILLLLAFLAYSTQVGKWFEGLFYNYYPCFFVVGEVEAKPQQQKKHFLFLSLFWVACE